MLGNAAIRMLDLRSTSGGFNTWPPRCQAATLGKSFTCSQRLWSHDCVALY